MEMQKDPTKLLSSMFGMGQEEKVVKPVRRNKRD